jgi:MFS family permease
MASLVALLTGYGLMQTGNTLQGTLLAVRGSAEGFSSVEIGAVGAAFWAGIVLGSLRNDRLIRRVGHIRTFAALGAVASTAPLIHLLVIHPIAWIAARALTGFCFAGMFVVVESWINGATRAEIRGRIVSIYGMTGLVAGIAGQLLISSADPRGFKLFCITATIIAVALVPITLTRSASPVLAASAPRASLRGLYQKSPFGAVTAFLCGVTTSSFFALGPVFAQRRGFDAGGIGLFMACGTLGGCLMAWPLGWLSDRYDRRIVVIGASLTAVTSITAIITLMPRGAPDTLVYTCVAILGATIIPTYSIVIAHVNDAVGRNEFVAASSCLLILVGVGAMVGPVVAGFAMDNWRHGLAYTIIAAQTLIAAWGIYRMRQVTRTTRHGPFMVEPSVPVGTALAPAHLQAS